MARTWEELRDFGLRELKRCWLAGRDQSDLFIALLPAEIETLERMGIFEPEKPITEQRFMGARIILRVPVDAEAA